MNRVIGMQADLFGAPEVPIWSMGKAPKPRTVKAKADAAVEAVSTGNEKLNPGWHAKAVELVREFAKANEPGWTIERAREVVGDLLPEPTDARAWGSVTRTLMRRRYIERTGDAAPADSSNGSIKPTYQRGPEA